MDTVDPRVFHNDTIQRFIESQFKDIFFLDSLVTGKKAIKLKDSETGELTKYYGYFLEKDKTKYFIKDFGTGEASVLDKFPIKIKTKHETDWNKDVFFMIDQWASVKIPSVQAIDFRKLIDTLAPHKHSNPIQFTLSKIINVTARCSRINYRIVAPKGFGKDSVLCNIGDLTGSTANIYGATFAKMEHSLKNKLLVFNEMGNIKEEDKFNLQAFLLATGAFSNKYLKKSRASQDTKEEYDISKTSLGILYNPPNYYIDKGQEFFDTLFTEAVLNRFMPFYFDGYLTEKFKVNFDPEELASENAELFRNIISTLKYYETNKIPLSPYKLPEHIKFGEDVERFERSFNTICDFIAMYALDQTEYTKLVTELYDCHLKFNKILKDTLSKR